MRTQMRSRSREYVVVGMDQAGSVVTRGGGTSLRLATAAAQAASQEYVAAIPGTITLHHWLAVGIKVALGITISSQCQHCGSPRPKGYTTCGDSHCQEAAYHANAAKAKTGTRN